MLPARPSDPVQVRLCHLWEVKVNDNIDSLYVDASCEEVGTDKVTAKAGPEVVEDSVPVGLGHLCMDVVTRVAKLGDLLGQKLHSLGRVAENDALQRWTIRFVHFQ